MSIEGHPVTKVCLIYKIMVLENVRRRLEEELRVFTRKASEDVQCFLRTAREGSRIDVVKLLNALDVKCTVIERLTGLFRQLMTELEDCSLNADQPNNHLHGPVLKRGRDVTISNVLKFRPMGYNCNVTLGNPATQSTGKQFEKPPQGVTSCLQNQGLGNDVIVHQKQTSSQLVQFLQTKCRNDLFTFFPKSDQLSVGSHATHLLIEGTLPEVKGKPVYMYQGTNGFLIGTSVPAFKVKEDRIDGVLRYSYIVSSKYELWDTGDIFIDENLILPRSRPQQVDVLELPSGACIEMKHKVIDVSQCSSSSSVQNIFTSGVRALDAVEQGDKVGKKVPAFQVRKYEEMAVTVTHVVNPSNFFIQHVGPELQQLSLAIDLHCSRSFAEMNCIPGIGTYVLGWFPRQKMWCRAQVLKINGMAEGASVNLGKSGSVQNIELEVRRIDYGDTVCIPLQSIKELDDLAAALPEQALQVALANVSPVNGQDWTPEAVCWFKDKVPNRTLFARLFPQETKVFVELFMEKGKIGAMRRSASLSVRLAQYGHASHKMMNINMRKSLNDGRDKNFKREVA